MKCVFLDGIGECYAELTRLAATWTVDEQTKKEYCTTKDFDLYPRFRAKMEFLTKVPVKEAAKKK